MEKRIRRREIELARGRRGGSRGESKLDSNQFHMCSPQSGPLREVHAVTQKRGGRRRQREPGQEKRESKGERHIQPVSSSQDVLHSPEYTKRLTEWVGKKRVREEIEATWWRKRRVKRGREQSRQWSNSQVKMGSEDWVLKRTKLITNTKKQILQVYSKG